jgi:hypothetical protein
VQQSNDARDLVGIVVDPELRILRACRLPHVGQCRVRDGPVVERETVGSTLRDRLVVAGQAANVRLAATRRLNRAAPQLMSRERPAGSERDNCRDGSA